jgi:hypothetical protein
MKILQFLVTSYDEIHRSFESKKKHVEMNRSQNLILDHR